MRTRSAAVAGTFYTADPVRLAAEVQTKIDVPNPGPRPLALIAPHAGYMYSGMAAGRAYARLKVYADSYKRVLLLGPAHRVPILGMATVSVQGFTTPLGDVRIDRSVLLDWVAAGWLEENDEAHESEHSLEVHLPFLQTVLGNFSLLPIVVGTAPREEVARLIDAALEDETTLVVVSTDLSHFHDEMTCRRLDAITAGKIEHLDTIGLTGEDACGCHSVNGLVALARDRGWTIERLALCHSGDSSGDHDCVVGYGAWAVNGSLS